MTMAATTTVTSTSTKSEVQTKARGMATKDEKQSKVDSGSQGDTTQCSGKRFQVNVDVDVIFDSVTRALNTHIQHRQTVTNKHKRSKQQTTQSPGYPRRARPTSDPPDLTVLLSTTSLYMWNTM